MLMRLVSIFSLLLTPILSLAAGDSIEKTFTLDDIRSLIYQNRSIIIEDYGKQIAQENLDQSKTVRFPDIRLDGCGYYANQIPLTEDLEASNAFKYDVSLSSEFDIYAGGLRKNTIQERRIEQNISDKRYDAIVNRVELQAFILLYDIYRNINYKKFIRSSIELREKEYERIMQLFNNGLVLKSDLLRSQLYITDLQKDEVTIENSIKILSEKFCVLLGLEEQFSVVPLLDYDLNYTVGSSFEDMWQYAYANAPELQVLRSSRDKEKIVMKEYNSTFIPHLKVYAHYGIGSPGQNLAFHHQLGGEVGVKLSMDIGSLYQTKYKRVSQKTRISQSEAIIVRGEEELRSSLLELYTRYNESLLNIQRAEQKIEMTSETTRILKNSYYNQQSLLIDVLESETKSMEASFEWVEAIVNSQKYYWMLRYASGYRK